MRIWSYHDNNTRLRKYKLQLEVSLFSFKLIYLVRGKEGDQRDGKWQASLYRADQLVQRHVARSLAARCLSAAAAHRASLPGLQL